MAARRVPGSASVAAVALRYSGSRGALKSSFAMNAAKSRVASSINGECQAPETFNGMTLAPSAFARFPARATISGEPEITVCTGVLKLARAMGPSLVKGWTSPFSFSGVRPMTAAMVAGIFLRLPVHEAAALGHRGDGIIGAQHPRGIQGAVLPQAVAAHRRGLNPGLRPGPGRDRG